MEPAVLIEKLKELAKKVNSADPQSAGRLDELATILETDDHRAHSTINLYGAINPESIQESVFKYAQRRPPWLAAIEMLRNVLVLVPICLTWYGLWKAAASYQQLIALNPSLVSEPFLLLWEKGFPGLDTHGVVTFSAVAKADFWLLFTIILLTGLIHLFRDVIEARAHDIAHKRRSDVEGLLWEVEKLLAQTRHTQNEQAVASDLLQHLRVEQQRLIDLTAQRRDEVESLAALGDRLVTSGEQLHRFAEEIRGVYDPLQNAIETLAHRIDGVSQHEVALVDAMSALSGRMDSLATSVTQATRDLHLAAEELGGSADAISKYAQMSAVSFDRIRDLFDDMSRRLDRVTENLRTATADAAGWSESLNETARSLSSIGQGLAPVAQTFPQQAMQLTTQLNESISNLGQSVRSLQTTTQGLETAASRITTFAASSVSAFADLGTRLNDLANHMNEIIAELAAAARDARAFARDIGGHITTLGQAGQALPVALDAFTQQTIEAAQQLTNAVQLLERSVSGEQPRRTWTDWVKRH